MEVVSCEKLEAVAAMRVTPRLDKSPDSVSGATVIGSSIWKRGSRSTASL